MLTPTSKLREILEGAGGFPDRILTDAHADRVRAYHRALDPTTITAIVKELLAWREFHADMTEHTQEALCLVCAEHMNDELSEALRKIEEAGKA